MRSLVAAVAVGVVLCLSGGQLQAAPFGNYTSGVTFATQPTYSFGPTIGTIALSGSTIMTAQTGAFAGVTQGVATGTLSFSMTPTVVLSESIVNLLTFVDPADTAGPPITFSVLSVETVDYAQSETDGDTIQLSILGETAGGAQGASGTASTLVLNLFGLSGMGITTSATLSNPPDADPILPPLSPNPVPTPSPVPVPEPATYGLLLAGIAGIVLMRRRGLIG